MKGVVFLGNKQIEIRSFPDPTPGPGEVVIQMKASGMCGSDLKFYRPPPGEAQKALGLGSNVESFIGGHEPCGVIDLPRIRGWIEDAGYTGFHEVEIFSELDWWRRDPDEVLQTCKDRFQKVT